MKEDLKEAILHLQKLISVPSFSNEEDEVAQIWVDWLRNHGVSNATRFHNNVYAVSNNFDSSKPLLLLNSHMDTVRPVASYTRDPFLATIEEGKIFGLGSNDAGGAGVALALTFLSFRERKDLPYNIMIAITASEERMGELGMRAFLPYLKKEGLYPDMAIVGEPTGNQAAIAERGLVVCDSLVKGKAGHAARGEGINAIYRAIEDIEKIRNISWQKESEILGPITLAVTMIEAGTQHNIIPDTCKYVIDIRTTDAYTNEETVKIVQNTTSWSEIKPRSTRIRASVLPQNNPLRLTAEEMGLKTFVSPTTSDMALMHDIPSIKIGPGKSERSHTEDEFILIEELEEGLEVYNRFLNLLTTTI